MVLFDTRIQAHDESSLPATPNNNAFQFRQFDRRNGPDNLRVELMITMGYAVKQAHAVNNIFQHLYLGRKRTSAWFSSR